MVNFGWWLHFTVFTVKKKFFEHKMLVLSLIHQLNTHSNWKQWCKNNSNNDAITCYNHWHQKNNIACNLSTWLFLGFSYVVSVIVAHRITF
jgi:hypothetical protein